MFDRHQIVSRFATARVLFGLGLLIRSGMPPEEALTTTWECAENFKDTLIKVRVEIMDGGEFQAKMAEDPRFEPWVINLLGVGEETARLDTALLAASAITEKLAEIKLGSDPRISQNSLNFALNLYMLSLLADQITPLTRCLEILSENVRREDVGAIQKIRQAVVDGDSLSDAIEKHGEGALVHMPGELFANTSTITTLKKAEHEDQIGLGLKYLAQQLMMAVIGMDPFPGEKIDFEPPPEDGTQ